MTFLLHLNLCFIIPGFPINPEGVQGCIHPRPYNVPGFLQDHLMRNVEQVAQLIGRSEDDVWILFYSLVQRIVNWNPAGYNQNNITPTLQVSDCIRSLNSL